GLSADEMLASLGPSGVRGLLVAGSNIAVASAHNRRVVEGLHRLDCLAVLDCFSNDTTRHADFVLPVTQWAEEDGTTTSLEGRVLRRRRAVTAPAGVRTDLEVLCALAARLGAGEHFVSAEPEAVFAELAGLSAGGRADYSGITYDRLDAEGGVFWPCPDLGHPGTPRLFGERFAHADGRARFVPVRYRPAAEEPDGEFPTYFTTGRYAEHYNSGAQTRLVSDLIERQPEPCLSVHPLVAARIGLRAGDPVVVESRRGEVTMRALIDPDIRPDTVFAPFHWGGDQAANRLTSPALDPTSRMPEFKVCAVRLRAAEALR
ncbi:MAG: molybdopterin-dependent oxidoreductase, partial [Acidimicrobiaceae bacterium]|nr:molybdopterin-dependent oxidoreductase [Acidimicrobiaceae bacterium]